MTADDALRVAGARLRQDQFGLRVEGHQGDGVFGAQAAFRTFIALR